MSPLIRCSIAAPVVLLVVAGLWMHERTPAPAAIPAARAQDRLPTGPSPPAKADFAPVGAEDMAALSSSPEADKAALTDLTVPPAERRRRAFALAHRHPRRALSALQALSAVPGTSMEKAALAEGLGESRDPVIVAEIDGLVSLPDERVARGAVRGIAMRESPEAAALLGTLLLDANQPDGNRTEAALALGRMKPSVAAELLLRASYEAVDSDDYETVFHAVASALAEQPDAKAIGFFTRLLEYPGTDTPQRAALLNDLGGGDARLAPLLFHYAHDPELETRAAAVMALDAQTGLDGNRRELQELLRTETDPALRLQLQVLVARLDDQGS